MILPAIVLALATRAPVAGITAVGRDVEVSAPASGRIVAVFSNVRIASRVSGDVIVWGGNVSFGPAGFVEGNVSVFGGRVEAPEGREPPVAGRVATPGKLLDLYLAEMRRAPWEDGGPALAVRGLRLIALSAWLIVSLALLYLFGSPFARAAFCAESDWSGSLLAGALGVLTLFLSAAAALTLLPAPVCVPVAVALAAFAVAAKVFGMGALFLLLGQKLLKNVSPSRRPAALATGFAVVAGLSLLPLVGAVLWSAASVVAVGIALLSRFGTPRYRVAV
ncbi:MAG TPA: hypothetical protein VLO07_07435 [Thermoanaerobaculia bacterium]|nr:hypothetical protein [Thermoanaerobaculia bacterium]